MNKKIIPNEQPSFWQKVKDFFTKDEDTNDDSEQVNKTNSEAI